MTRSVWIYPATWLLLVGIVLPTILLGNDRPNILLAISDDQSFPHASIYGTAEIETPAFDRIARNGVLFHDAYSGSPGCSPSRAALLTGRHHWSLENAGTHASSFPARWVTLPDKLEAIGYFVGYTGKGWGPGNFKISGRTRNPAGPSFAAKKLPERQPKGISANDYASNFADFVDARPDDQPFFFWFGASEPHRGFERGSGIAVGKQPQSIAVPTYLPDNDVVRSDLLDYFLEIEHFDRQLSQMISLLEERGLMKDTLVIVTSDNGMPFPRAKANCYDACAHVPLAISWPNRLEGGQNWHSPVGFVDLHRTILASAGVPNSQSLPGHDLLKALESPSAATWPVFFGRERHSSSRWNNWGYPQRAVRSGDFLYIRNFHPERWPAGAPQKYARADSLGPPHGGYHDIDACPTLSWMIEHRREPEALRCLALAVDHRPAEELFNVSADPDCVNNLIDSPDARDTRAKLSRLLLTEMGRTEDPRAGDESDVFETYPRYSPLRSFPRPAWAEPNE